MEQRSEKEHPSLNTIHSPGGKCEIIPLAPPFDQRSTKWDKEQEEWAKRKAWEHHKEPFPGKGHCGDVHNTDFFKSYLPMKAIVLDLRFIQKTSSSPGMTHSGKVIQQLPVTCPYGHD